MVHSSELRSGGQAKQEEAVEEGQEEEVMLRRYKVKVETRPSNVNGWRERWW